MSRGTGSCSSRRARDPRAIIPRLHANGVKFVAIVGSTRAAQRTAAAGADAVVVQGNEAGGHVGSTGTLSLAQSALRAVGCPMLVAGGIGTAAAARSALALGAAGVSVGTRFIAATESDAHPAYKAAVVGAGENATLVTRACTGKPSRALCNAFVERWIGREAEIQPYPAQAVENFWRARAGSSREISTRASCPSASAPRWSTRSSGRCNRRDARRGGAPGMNEGWRGLGGAVVLFAKPHPRPGVMDVNECRCNRKVGL